MRLEETYGGFMKKSVLFVTAALSFGAASAQVATTAAPAAPATAQTPVLTDVPAGHWARDAVQRLVSQGIILGFPDGTYRGTQNLTRYEAAMIISRLLDQIGSGETKVANIDDATLLSVRNAINELSAELAALDVRVSDLENNAVTREDFARLEGRVNALANTPATGTAATDPQVTQQLAAVNDLTTLLNQDVLALQDRVTTLDGQLSSFDDRVGVIEDQVAQNTASINDQEGRIGKLEDGRVRLTLGVGGGYGQLRRTQGKTNFDVDRVTEGTFAEGAYTLQSDDDTSANTRVRGVDTEDKTSRSLEGGIEMGIKATDIGIGLAGGLVVEEAGVNFGFDPAAVTTSTRLGADPDTNHRYLAYLSSAEATGRIGDDARFRVKAGAVRVDARPDVVNPVSKLKDIPGYNDYVLPSGVNNGVTAGVALTSAPFSPTLYLSSGYGNSDALRGNYVAARVEGKLGETVGNTIGVSFVQNFAGTGGTDPKTAENAGRVISNADGRTIFSVDGHYHVPDAQDAAKTLYGVKAVYAASAPDAFAEGTNFNTAFEKRDQAAELSAEANLFNVGARANLRAVTPGYANFKDYGDGKTRPNAALDVARYDDNKPKYADEVGYGASLSTKIGAAEVGFAADTYTNYYNQDWSNRRYTVGGHAGTNLNAFRVVGFGSYTVDQTTNRASNPVTHSGTVDNARGVVRYVEDGNRWAGNPVGSGVSALPAERKNSIFAPSKVTGLYNYTTGVGALVTHDGTAENALVKNLDLAALGEYNYNSQDYYAAGFAAYNAQAGNFTVTPFVGASLYQQNAGNRDGAADNSRVQGGVRVSSAPLDVAFRPEFKAALGAAYYQTGAIDAASNGVSGTRGAVNGNQWGGTAEVKLNDFFVPSATLSLGYGYRQVNGLRDDAANKNSKLLADVTDFRFGGAYAAPVADARYNNSSRTQGVFTQLAWNEALKFNYGVFFNQQLDANGANQGDTNVAHGFKVAYGVKF